MTRSRGQGEVTVMDMLSTGNDHGKQEQLTLNNRPHPIGSPSRGRAPHRWTRIDTLSEDLPGANERFTHPCISTEGGVGRTGGHERKD